LAQVWANSNSNFANDEKFQAQPLSTLPFVKAFPCSFFLLQIVVDAQDNFNENDNNHENKEVSTPPTPPLSYYC
jgi:hypothetical protein